MAKHLPVVYSPLYNMCRDESETSRLLREAHCKDFNKPTTIIENLAHEIANGEVVLYEPGVLRAEDVGLVHSPRIVEQVFAPSAEFVADFFCIPVELAAKAKGQIMQSEILSGAGTLRAVDLALQHGYAVNLGGGHHHPYHDVAEGFGAFSDVGVAIQKFLNSKTDADVLIVDVDVHQGQGHERIFWNEPRVRIMDMFNCRIYPLDIAARERINYPGYLEPGTGDTVYGQLFQSLFNDALAFKKPDLIFLIAGSDVAAGDKLGQMELSRGAIVRRDAFVFQKAIAGQIPVVMTTAGGYQKNTGVQVAESIKTVCQRYLHIGRVNENGESRQVS